MSTSSTAEQPDAAPPPVGADGDQPSADGKQGPCWQIASGPIGAVYEGELSIRGKADGRGKLSFANGDVYEGEFKAGRMEGYGKMLYADGDSYEGDWKSDEHHGKGKYTFPPPSIAYYEGELNQGAPPHAARPVRAGSRTTRLCPFASLACAAVFARQATRTGTASRCGRTAPSTRASGGTTCTTATARSSIRTARSCIRASGATTSPVTAATCPPAAPCGPGDSGGSRSSKAGAAVTPHARAGGRIVAAKDKPSKKPRREPKPDVSVQHFGPAGERWAVTRVDSAAAPRREDGAPPASQGHSEGSGRALRAPGAPPEPLGGPSWPQDLASGRRQDELFSSRRASPSRAGGDALPAQGGRARAARVAGAA